MRKWIAAICLCAAMACPIFTGQAMVNEVGQANELYKAGKKLEALPLYEDLAKTYPNEMIYQERLASCLDAEAEQTNDLAQKKALLTRMRDAARRAVQLGEKANFVQDMANFDVDAPDTFAQGSSAEALMQEAEKAFAAGDYPTAEAKYAAAAAADPQLYVAALYAGDAAYAQHDLPTAARWFARAIVIDPNRETAYRYWGDAILQYGSDAEAAKNKFIDAIVAEPYNKYSWQGLQQWAVRQKAVLSSPRIDRPAAPAVDPKNPGNIAINIDPSMTDDKQHPGSSAWMVYSMGRAGFRGDQFKKQFPNEKEYRHTLKEEDDALSMVVTVVREQKIPPDKLDESLRNLLEVYDAGMLDCWILINGADQGIVQDYAAYRDAHRQLLHDYLARFVVHGGVSAAQ
jgi:tetratricopeptide (TPR) repeat protein